MREEKQLPGPSFRGAASPGGFPRWVLLQDSQHPLGDNLLGTSLVVRQAQMRRTSLQLHQYFPELSWAARCFFVVVALFCSWKHLKQWKAVNSVQCLCRKHWNPVAVLSLGLETVQACPKEKPRSNFHRCDFQT